MFYIGSNVMDWPLEAQRAVSDGVFIYAICVAQLMPNSNQATKSALVSRALKISLSIVLTNAIPDR